MQNITKFRCDFGIGDSIGHLIIWILLTIVTLGLALFVFPYYLISAIVNKTTAMSSDGTEAGALRSNITLASVVGNAFIWILLTIVTFGLAYFVYFYRVVRIVLSDTTIEYNAK